MLPDVGFEASCGLGAKWTVRDCWRKSSCTGISNKTELLSPEPPWVLDFHMVHELLACLEQNGLMVSRSAVPSRPVLGAHVGQPFLAR